jgi:hypothetical protein
MSLKTHFRTKTQYRSVIITLFHADGHEGPIVNNIFGYMHLPLYSNSYLYKSNNIYKYSVGGGRKVE